MRQVVIYPGRFQPMLKHHVEVYNQLQRDYPDADVYFGTSNKVDGDKSPFNFLEKQEIAGAHGISPDRIIQVTNPYKKDDYEFDQDKTLLVFAVGEKDKSRLPVNNIDPSTGLNVKKSDGEASYLQDISLLSREGYNAEPMSKRGYVALAPNVETEGELASASAFRQSFANAHDEEHAKEIFLNQFGQYNEVVFNLLLDKLVRKEMSEQLDKLKKLAGLQEAAPVVYSPDKEVYGFEEPEDGLNFNTDDFEPFDRKKSPAKQSRTFEPTSPKDARASAERPAKAAGSNPEQAEFIPFDPDKFGRKHQKFSITNRFGGKDPESQSDKQEVFIQELLSSPNNILGEINSRLANDDNSLAVGDRLSSILSSMPESGVGGLAKDDKQFIIKLVANAVKNMDLPEPFVDPEEELEDSVNFDDIRSEYDVVETKLTEKKIFMIGAKKTNGEPGILVLKKGGIFSSDKDDIVLGNHPREVARQLVKHGYGPGDRFDYHYSFKKAQTADPAYGFRHGEVSDIMGDVENAIYFDQDQQDLFSQPRYDKTGTESIQEGGDCHHCKGDDPDCDHCDGSGYVQFDDDPNEPSQEEIDAYWDDIVKLSGIEKSDVDENAYDDAYDEIDARVNDHIDKHAIRGKDLEKYVGQEVTLWTEGSSNPPLQRTYEIDPGKNGQGVTIEGTYYGPEEFVDHNAAADYSWKSEEAADIYSELHSEYEKIDMNESIDHYKVEGPKGKIYKVMSSSPAGAKDEARKRAYAQGDVARSASLYSGTSSSAFKIISRNGRPVEESLAESDYWDWDDPKIGYRHGQGFKQNFALWKQEIKKERSQHGDPIGSEYELLTLFLDLAKRYGVDIDKEHQIDKDNEEKAHQDWQNKLKDIKPLGDREMDMASKVYEDGHLPELPYEGEVDFMMDGDDGEPQDGSLTYTVVNVDHEAPGYGVEIDPDSLKWSATGPINPSAKLDDSDFATRMLHDSDFTHKEAMQAAKENEEALLSDYWRSYADGMERESVELDKLKKLSGLA